MCHPKQEKVFGVLPEVEYCLIMFKNVIKRFCSGGLSAIKPFLGLFYPCEYDALRLTELRFYLTGNEFHRLAE